MDTNEQISRNQAVIDRSRPLENLLANPDFQAWQQDTVQERLIGLSIKVLGTNREDSDWKEKLATALIAYQEAKYVYEDLFGEAVSNANQARKAIDALKAPPA